jgi:hypothetical protein
MSDFTRFKQVFGAPRPGTAADLGSLGLPDCAPLVDFSRQVGGGVFGRGLVSVASVREQVSSLGGWERLLPPDPRLLATSAFGFLLLTTNEADVWIVDTQNNDVFEADMTIEAALLKFCDDDVREELLLESLFRAWSQDVIELEPTKVLNPTPALALGGVWSPENLRETDLAISLSLTAQLFT